MLTLQNISDNEFSVKSGDVFPETGCYSFVDHVDETHGDNCIIPKQVYRMMFKKGYTAPKLISCYHDVYWKLIFKQ